MPAIDPFTQTHTALWAAFIAWTPWAALVKPGDRIDVTQQSGQPRKVIGGRVPADFENCEIEQGPFQLLPGNSRAGKIVQTYRVFLATDDKKVISANEVKYESYRALYARGASLGLPFVSDWTITGGEDDYGKSEAHAGREGYKAAFAINVEMMIDRNTLLTP